MTGGGSCIYSKKTQEEYPWTSPTDDKSCALCNICHTTVNISSGKAKLDRHLTTKKHLDAAKPANDNNKVPTSKLNTYFKSKAEHLSSVEQVAKAEVYHVLKIAVNNQSFSSSNTENGANQISYLQFPDSDIAKKMKCGMNKSKYILNALCEGIQVVNGKKLAEKSFFGIHVDESTKANKGKLEFYVTYLHEDNRRKTEFLDSMDIEYNKEKVLSALRTGNIETIKNAIDTTLTDASSLVQATSEVIMRNNLIPERFMFIMTDNCNTMGGNKNGYKKKLKELYPSIVSFDGCSVHHINTAVKKIRNGPLKDFFHNLKQLNGFIHTHGKVTHFFTAIDDLLMYNKLPKEAPTRFLYLSNVIEAIKEKFCILRTFIEASKERIDMKKYPTLLEWIRRESTPVYIDQVSLILSPFKTTMTKLQANDLTILQQRTILETLITSNLTRIGQIEKIDHNRHIAQHYQRTDLRFNPKKYKRKTGYKIVYTRSKSMTSFYEGLSEDCLLTIDNKVAKAREEVLAALLEEIKGFATHIVTRNAQILTKEIKSVKEASIKSLSVEIPQLNTAKILEEYDDLITHHGAKSLTEILQEFQNYPSFRTLKTVYDLFTPHNMEVERGFNIAGDILTKKRSTMTHELYRNLRIVKSVFPSIESIQELEQIWPNVYPFIQNAARQYTEKIKEDAKNNERKRKLTDETRNEMGLAAKKMTPAQKKQKKQVISAEVKRVQERMMELQNQLDTIEESSVVTLL